MLVVGLKYRFEASNYFKYAIDLYSFRRSTQQMCSVVEILGSSNTSLLYDDYTIHSFETYFNPMDIDEQERYVYHWKDDGFLHQEDGMTKIEKDVVSISDTDGYVNVRREPNSKSDILYTIPDKTLVIVWFLPNSNWAEVVAVLDGENNVRSILGGYVHRSRLQDN